MKKKIISIVCINFTLPVLLCSSLVYAGVSEAGGNGVIYPSVLSVVSVGDNEKFQEDHWMTNNVQGGVSDYNYINEDQHGGSIVADGRVVAGNNDYLFNFDLKKEGIGSLIFDFKQFRKYYDGTGGFFSNFAPTAASRSTYLEADRALFLDIGNFKIEGTLSKEENAKCIFLYEREYRQGTKSLTSWGSVVEGGTTRNILPTFLETDEIVDKFEMKIEHTTPSGIEVSAEQGYEKVRVANQKVNNRTYNLGTGVFSSIRYKYENLNADIYTTILRISKELNERVFLSIAFLEDYNVGKTEEVITDTLAPGLASTAENHPLNPQKVRQNQVSVLPKATILLLENLTMDVGLKWEWIKTKAVGTYNKNRATATVTDEFVDLEVKKDDNHIGETFGLKYDGMRDVIFYADGELEQQLRNEDESQRSFGPQPVGTDNFSRDQNILSLDYDVTSGFKWYPISKVNVTAEFKYKHGTRDYTFLSTTKAGDVVGGYRGFLDEIEYTSYKPLVMFNCKPFRWLACNFRYALDTTVYGVRTPAAEATEKAQYLAHIYSAGATLTPKDCLYMTLFYQYKQASTETQANGNGGSVERMPTYNASFRTLSASCGYSPVKDITLKGDYSFSNADNFNDFVNIGLPLGLDNFSQDASIGIEKKLRGDCSVEFKYDFTQYHETSNGGIDDYEAHLFYTGLKMKF
ncbi:MAG: hypothetical protein Q8R38_02675 [Candidatus Omnitrophota bacterium]|nr:hypothetical protein [Candidatus Omnitrophota bacterium]